MNDKAKWIVCPECEGEGSHGPGFTWTQDEVAQEDPEEFAELQERLRAGDFNVACELCKGRRVVTQQEINDWEELAALRHMEAMERRYGA